MKNESGVLKKKVWGVGRAITPVNKGEHVFVMGSGCVGKCVRVCIYTQAQVTTRGRSALTHDYKIM